MRKREFDLQEVERLASELGTKGKVSDALKMGKGSIYHVQRVDAKFKEALERGLKTFKKAKKKPEKTVSAKGMRDKILQALSFDNGLTVQAIAEMIGENPTATQIYLSELKSEGRVSKRFDRPLQTHLYQLPPSIETKAAGENSPPARQLILEAIKNGNHLGRRIAEETGLPAGVILDELEILKNLEVEFAEEANFTAYFLKGQKPANRLMLDGMGGVREVKPKPITVAEPMSVKKAEEIIEKLAAEPDDQILSEDYEIAKRIAEEFIKELAPEPPPKPVLLEILDDEILEVADDDILEIGPIGNARLTIEIDHTGQGVLSYEVKNSSSGVLELIRRVQALVENLNENN